MGLHWKAYTHRSGQDMISMHLDETGMVPLKCTGVAPYLYKFHSVRVLALPLHSQCCTPAPVLPYRRPYTAHV